MTHTRFWRIFFLLALLLVLLPSAKAEVLPFVQIVSPENQSIVSGDFLTIKGTACFRSYSSSAGGRKPHFYPRRPIFYSQWWRLRSTRQDTLCDNQNYGQKLDRVEIQVTNGTLFLANNGLITDPVWLTATGTDDWSYSSLIPFSDFPRGNYKITAKAFDTNGQVREKSISVKNGIALAYTELSLFPNSKNILQNDLVEVTGKLKRRPHFANINLSDNTINLEIIAPDGKSAQKETKTDKLGNYHFTLQSFTHEGTYILKSSFAGNDHLSWSKSEPEEIRVGTSAGYAVLVQGKVTNNEGLKSHNKTLNRVYNKLKHRGFIPDDIRYFNYLTNQDLDQDGTNDIFAIPNKPTIQTTIETWACERIKGSPAPFYLIMVDHGSPHQFHLGNETITPTELNTWLENLETCLGKVSEPRVVVLGSCYSGSFISALSKKGRIIISSANEDETSYKGRQEADGIRGGEFFIEAFFQQLSDGFSLKEAFEGATEWTERFTHRGHFFTQKMFRFLDRAMQHPLLDDNGDGIGSNVLTVNGDGNQAASLMFGAGHDYLVNAPDNPAEILEVTQPQYLTEREDDTSVQLFLQANAPDKVEPATIEIRPPSKIIAQVQNSSEQIALELESHFLKYNEESDLFEFTYTGFTESGRYDIFYTVRDAYTGEISPFSHSVVYKNRPGNSPPKPFKLKSPVDNAQLQTVLVFDWEKTDDPDQEPITYSLSIAEDQNFNQMVYQANELTHSMTFIEDEGSYLVVDESDEDKADEIHFGLKDLTDYFWKVEAVDIYGARTSSEIRHFYTNNSNAPPGIASVQVYNALDYTPIENVHFTFNQNPPGQMFAEQGLYHFPLFSGLYQMWLTAPGYLPRRTRAKADFIPLEIATGQATEINVFLEPCVPSCGNLQPAQFLLETKLLTIPALKVADGGDFSVQLQADESFTFTVLMDKLTELSAPTDYIAHFSVKTGQLFLPRVAVIDKSGTETLYRVTMKLSNPELLQFTLVDGVEIQ